MQRGILMMWQMLWKQRKRKFSLQIGGKYIFFIYKNKHHLSISILRINHIEMALTALLCKIKAKIFFLLFCVKASLYTE